MTPEQYHTRIFESLIDDAAEQIEAAQINPKSSKGGLGDEVGDLILKLNGLKATSEDETRSVLALVRASVSKPETIAQSARAPSQSLRLLRHLGEWTDQENLKQEIAGTIAYVEAQSR
jgi:hypothetical protein